MNSCEGCTTRQSPGLCQQSSPYKLRRDNILECPFCNMPAGISQWGSLSKAVCGAPITIYRCGTEIVVNYTREELVSVVHRSAECIMHREEFDYEDAI